MLLLLSVATWLTTANPQLEEGRALFQSLRYERGVGTVLAVQASSDSRAADQAPWASETRELDARARRKALQSHFLIGGALVGGAGAVVLLTAF
ncbi:hypothetical protein [Hyalangium sp.]|uniref:hypothetical protein n=1 Tax=Hyalangium sp. TaxID=2028555 RepID=UPI002D588600|nr:hypothetical protein [Hyalangium sp.]HYI00959.1 hypothetical protein [Hyalangium sp.]